MHTNSLTLPFLPGASPSGFPEAKRWLRIPDCLRFESQSSKDSSIRRAEKHLSKSAQRGQHIVFGTPEAPYEPLALGGAPLAALRRFDGLAITITTRSSEILEQLDLLVELDQSHTVAVDLLIASFDPGSADFAERLQTVSTLSAQGITTRLVVTDLPRFTRGAGSRIRELLEAAKRSSAFDVTTLENSIETEAWSRLMRYLRLELGFPRAVPGRG